MSGLGDLRVALRRQPRGSGRPARRKRSEYSAYLFLLPWIVGILGITLGPMVASLVLSFTDYDLLQAPGFIGLHNYAQIFQDPNWRTSVSVTVTYVAVSVPLQLAVALGFAMLLDQGLRGLAFYRSVLYLPSMLGASVAIAILWRQLFGTDGIVNSFLGLFGIPGHGWVSSPDTALWTIVLLHIWTFGSPMIIFLAGLRQIPRMYYEAAEVDGAGRWRRFRSITIPMLSPVIFFNLVLQVIGSFQSFAGLCRLRRYRRAEQRHAVLLALHVPAGIHELPDGLRLGDGLAPAARDRRGDRAVLRDGAFLGSLRGLRRS